MADLFSNLQQMQISLKTKLPESFGTVNSPQWRKSAFSNWHVIQ